MARPKHPERCGRSTGHENDNTTAIEAATAGASLITAKAKELAQARRAASPVCMEQMENILAAWSNYIDECQHSGQSMTWAGFAMAADISVTTLYRMKAGELDHIVEEYRLTHDIPDTETEYINEDGQVISLLPWSKPCQKLEALIQDQLERNCYTNKGNPAGSIFGLKARFDWEDSPDRGNTTYSSTLVIADSEQAKKAMKMLTNVEI